MTTLVQQRSGKDCVLCSAAMALGLTYEQAAERAGAAFMALMNAEGCSDGMERALLQALGLTAGADYKALVFSHRWATVEFTRNMLWRRRALVTVRSRNHANRTHLVYWDGAKLWDPSTEETYKDLAETEPVELLLLPDAAERQAV